MGIICTRKCEQGAFTWHFTTLKIAVLLLTSHTCSQLVRCSVESVEPLLEGTLTFTACTDESCDIQFLLFACVKADVETFVYSFQAEAVITLQPVRAFISSPPFSNVRPLFAFGLTPVLCAAVEYLRKL